MKRIRTVIGLSLVIAAVAGLIYWELDGREAVLMDQFLVARKTILSGTLVTADMFSEAGILEENKIEAALKPEQLPDIIGKVAAQRIIKNDQVVAEYFIENDFYFGEGESLFVIRPEWITMRSSSLRRGDWIEIYEDRDHKVIGTYRVAFVKDNNEVEVRDSGKVSPKSALERADATSIISHIEIISDLPGYEKILNCVSGITSAGLILVQREEGLL